MSKFSPDGMKFNLECNIIKSGIPTENGRIYSEEALRKLTEQSNIKAKEGRLLGRYGFPPCGTDLSKIKLDNVAFKANNFTIKDGKVCGEFEILDTPCGKKLKAELTGKDATLYPIMVIDGNGIGGDGKIDPKTLDIITWDVVSQEDIDARNAGTNTITGRALDQGTLPSSD